MCDVSFSKDNTFLLVAVKGVEGVVPIYLQKAVTEDPNQDENKDETGEDDDKHEADKKDDLEKEDTVITDGDDDNKSGGKDGDDKNKTGEDTGGDENNSGDGGQQPDAPESGEAAKQWDDNKTWAEKTAREARLKETDVFGEPDLLLEIKNIDEKKKDGETK